MPYEDVLVHLATPLTVVTAENWLGGDPDEDEVPLTPIPVCLFLPLGGEENSAPRGRRSIRRPTLLMGERDLADDLTDYLVPSDQLDVLAPELTGPDPLRWQIDGWSQPFGPPGEEPIGRQAILKRVED